MEPVARTRPGIVEVDPRRRTDHAGIGPSRLRRKTSTSTGQRVEGCPRLPVASSIPGHQDVMLNRAHPAVLPQSMV